MCAPHNAYELGACATQLGGAYYLPDEKKIIMCDVMTDLGSFRKYVQKQNSMTLIAAQTAIHELLHATADQNRIALIQDFRNEIQVMHVELQIADASGTDGSFILARLFNNDFAIQSEYDTFVRYFRPPLEKEIKENCNSLTCGGSASYLAIQNIFNNLATKMSLNDLPDQLLAERIRGVFLPPGNSGYSVEPNSVMGISKSGGEVKIFLSTSKGLGFKGLKRCISSQKVKDTDDIFTIRLI
jgi:hypothetical protein